MIQIFLFMVVVVYFCCYYYFCKLKYYNFYFNFVFINDNTLEILIIHFMSRSACFMIASLVYGSISFIQDDTFTVCNSNIFDSITLQIASKILTPIEERESHELLETNKPTNKQFSRVYGMTPTKLGLINRCW